MTWKNNSHSSWPFLVATNDLSFKEQSKVYIASNVNHNYSKDKYSSRLSYFVGKNKIKQKTLLFCDLAFSPACLFCLSMVKNKIQIQNPVSKTTTRSYYVHVKMRSENFDFQPML